MTKKAGYFTCFQVSVHGLVTFSTSERARAFTYTLVTWPNPLYPEGADPPFIAPFYAETDFRAGEPSVMEPSRLYYRVLTRSTAASDTQARIDTGTVLFSEYKRLSKNITSETLRNNSDLRCGLEFGCN